MSFADFVLLVGIESTVDPSSIDVICVEESGFDVIVETEEVLITGISVYG